MSQRFRVKNKEFLFAEIDAFFLFKQNRAVTDHPFRRWTQKIPSLPGDASAPVEEN